jgi:mannose-1-phosphate guanylyltransferase/mannose-6-phosphate isomerase
MRRLGEFFKDVNNSIGFSESRGIVLFGIDDVVVVDTPENILVMDRYKSEELGSIYPDIVAALGSSSMEREKVHRPWGWYHNLEYGAGFKVKRIRVNSHSSISLQKHSHRSEHWVVVSGRALVTKGDEKSWLLKDESIFIRKGEVHRIENQDALPLDIIEVQTGDYLEEDDIVRYSDDYGRAD